MTSTKNERGDTSESVDVLGVFAKFWQPGQVKTRLAHATGDESAVAVYRASLLATLDRLERLDVRRVLAFTPLVHRGEFAALEPVADDTWSLTLQSGGDLGERMAAFFVEQFRSGAHRVVLLGSDSPTLPLEFVSQAFDRLGEHDVVIGPSGDGGYYLVGQSSPRPAMFADIDWSSEQVWSQTRARLDARDIGYAVLPEWYDIDTVADAQRLVRELDEQDSPNKSLAFLHETVRSALARCERRD